jgi:putative SOS response-associated peptidase YedK
VEVFDVPELTFELEPRYNIAPGQDALIVGQDRKGRRAGMLRWGFVPAGSAVSGRGFVNARAERVAQAPSFREAYARRRCLVPADGFYEWSKEDEGKVPHWFHPRGGGLLAMAGIWEGWEPRGAVPRFTFAVLTTAAGDDVRDVHPRMPVILAPDDWGRWLDPSTDPGELRRLLAPAPAGSLQHHAVSRRVNAPEHDDPSLVEPL